MADSISCFLIVNTIMNLPDSECHLTGNVNMHICLSINFGTAVLVLSYLNSFHSLFTYIRGKCADDIVTCRQEVDVLCDQGQGCLGVTLDHQL